LRDVVRYGAVLVSLYGLTSEMQLGGAAFMDGILFGSTDRQTSVQ